ncbi:MAG: LexA family transcriptional regulator [Desulfobulbaceae bacterium BRH_c16a]|nr:MAG: LexA family transcriptional regulator [Desulfobulbaceae bacterium BRH_c16a]
MELTEKQQQFLDYLTERMDDDGRIPTLRQAAGDLGVSHTAVAQLMTQLEKKGVLARDGHYSRTIRLYSGHGEQRSARRGRELPIIGQITAGLPMYAQQEWEGMVLVDPSIFAGENLFCLRIKGQSMKDAGIFDGDLVVCEPRQYAENGEVVAVLVRGEEATVKRFFLYADHIELRPANDAFPVMCYPFGDLLVQGKVIGVIRGRHAEYDGKRK